MPDSSKVKLLRGELARVNRGQEEGWILEQHSIQIEQLVEQLGNGGGRIAYEPHRIQNRQMMQRKHKKMQSVANAY